VAVLFGAPDRQQHRLGLLDGRLDLLPGHVREPVDGVVPIFQTAPLLVLVFSAALLPRRLERVTPRLVAAAAVVVVGTTIVSLSS